MTWFKSITKRRSSRVKKSTATKTKACIVNGKVKSAYVNPNGTGRVHKKKTPTGKVQNRKVKGKIYNTKTQAKSALKKRKSR